MAPACLESDQLPGRRTEMPLSAWTTVCFRNRSWSCDACGELFFDPESSPPPANSRTRAPIRAAPTSTAPIATLRRPQSSPGLCSRAGRARPRSLVGPIEIDAGRCGAASALPSSRVSEAAAAVFRGFRDWLVFRGAAFLLDAVLVFLPEAVLPERLDARFAAASRRSPSVCAEAGRFLLPPGFFALLRRRDGGRPSAPPLPLPSLDRLAMTPPSRGQGEAAEDQRATDHREGEQVRTGEGQLAVPVTGRRRPGSRAVAGSTTVAAAAISTVVATLAAGALGAAGVDGGDGGGRTRSHGVALRTGRRRLQQRRVAGHEREHGE